MYQVLARKYRPKNFHELLGQNHVARALINAIDHGRLHHAYLFTGTRGVGKTTIARILAKCLNCETGITSEPCGICQTCQAINAGRFIDLIEIDAASRTKVEDTREILDNVPYAPTQGRYKVYLIDEVHMLSNHSFNALLKTLEEPPEHVKFLLATTDPQKLPITIISRCLQFVLRPLSQQQLVEYLSQILQKENVTFQIDGLWQLANSAKGSVRDALSLTDQAIAFGNGQIQQDTIKQMLGLIDQADVVAILQSIYQQNPEQLANYIQLLRNQVVDAKSVFDSLAELLHQVALLQLLPNFDLQLNQQQTHARQQLAQTIPAELLQLYYEIIVKCRENIGLANTPLQALEMCLLRLLAFKPLLPNQVYQFTANDVTSSFQGNQQQAVVELTNPIIETEQPTIIVDVTSSNNFSENDTQDKSDETNNDNSQLISVNDTTSQETIVSEPHHDFNHLEIIDINQEISTATIEAEQPTIITDVTSSDDFAENDTQDKSDETNNDNSQLISANDTTPQETIVSEPHHDFNHLEIIDINQEISTATIEAEQSTTITYVISSDDFAENDAQNKSDETNNDNSQLISVNDTTPQETIVSEPHHDNDYYETIENISLLDYLQPEPQLIDLEGQWTERSWDYWVSQARANQWLDNDELVLAKKGLLLGNINGKCQFITTEKVLSASRTFNQFCIKLQQFFPNIQVSLNNNPESEQLVLLNNTPENQQLFRKNQVIQLATEQLKTQPVMQALLSQQASLIFVKLTT